MGLVVIDTEGTSTHRYQSRMLSLAALTLDVEGLNITKIEEWFFAQIQPVPRSATKVHGLTMENLEELSGGKSLEESLSLMEHILYGGHTLIGHNISYDRDTIKTNIVNAGGREPMWNNIIDTLSLARQKIPDGRVSNHKLETVFRYVCERERVSLQLLQRMFQYKAGDKKTLAHNAAWDAFMTFRVYRYLR